MCRNNILRAAKLGYILISIALCVLGVIVIAVPDYSAVLLCRIGGIIMVLFGGVKILGYCSKDLYRLAFQHDLALGTLLVILGAVMIFRTAPVISVLCTMLGMLLLADALLKIQIAIDSKMFGIKKWWMILCVAIQTGILGFLLMLRPSESARMILALFGLSLLTEGILNLITVLTVVRLIHPPLPEADDTDYI